MECSKVCKTLGERMICGTDRDWAKILGKSEQWKYLVSRTSQGTWGHISNSNIRGRI